MNNYKTFKVFQCSDMPDQVRSEFWKQTSGHGNDCCVYWKVSSSAYFCDETDQYLPNPEHTAVDLWLYVHGAFLYETVLIEHSW